MAHGGSRRHFAPSANGGTITPGPGHTYSVLFSDFSLPIGHTGVGYVANWDATFTVVNCENVHPIP